MARTASRTFRTVLRDMFDRDGTAPEDIDREIQTLRVEDTVMEDLVHHSVTLHGAAAPEELLRVALQTIPNLDELTGGADLAFRPDLEGVVQVIGLYCISYARQWKMEKHSAKSLELV